MSDKKYKWYKIADSADIIEWQNNDLAVVELASKKITLCRFENHIYACAYKCPHAGGILSDGFIDHAGNIVCPIHRYRFDLDNGRNVTGEGYFLKTYKIDNREDGIYIGFEEKNFFGWM